VSLPCYPVDGAESAILPEQMKSIKVSTSQDSDITLSPCKLVYTLNVALNLHLCGPQRHKTKISFHTYIN